MEIFVPEEYLKYVRLLIKAELFPNEEAADSEIFRTGLDEAAFDASFLQGPLVDIKTLGGQQTGVHVPASQEELVLLEEISHGFGASKQDAAAIVFTQGLAESYIELRQSPLYGVDPDFDIVDAMPHYPVDELDGANDETELWYLGDPFLELQYGPNRFSVQVRREDDYVFCKVNGGWRIRYAGGNELLLKHLKGFDYIAFLLGYPNRDIHVLKLAGLVEGTPGNGSSSQSEDQLHAESTYGPDPIMDERYRESIKRRLEELREKRSQAMALHDDSAMRDIEDEIEEIRRQWKAARRFGGRSRNFSSKHEKERLRIRMLIDYAMTRIAKEDEALYRHLGESLKMGSTLSYDPLEAPPWHISR